MSDLVFEVTIVVESRVVDAFEVYMTTKHIPDVIATGCFKNAWFGREGNEYRVSYLTTRDQFEHYLAKYAPSLRQDFTEHFPGGVELTRRNWDVIRSFPS